MLSRVRNLSYREGGSCAAPTTMRDEHLRASSRAEEDKERPAQDDACESLQGISSAPDMESRRPENLAVHLPGKPEDG